MPAEFDQRIDLFRKQDPELVENAINAVARRGGSATHWRVNIAQGTATRGLLTVYVYETSDGTLAPNGYQWMGGKDIDTEQDCCEIEDAYACLMEAFRSAIRGRILG